VSTDATHFIPIPNAAFAPGSTPSTTANANPFSSSGGGQQEVADLLAHARCGFKSFVFEKEIF
jgi:hypothetical protein